MSNNCDLQIELTNQTIYYLIDEGQVKANRSSLNQEKRLARKRPSQSQPGENRYSGESISERGHDTSEVAIPGNSRMSKKRIVAKGT